jgi:hypothetical protein
MKNQKTFTPISFSPFIQSADPPQSGWLAGLGRLKDG